MATSRITLQAAIFNLAYLNNSSPSSCQVRWFYFFPYAP
jgi:hypothetical protein